MRAALLRGRARRPRHSLNLRTSSAPATRSGTGTPGLPNEEIRMMRPARALLVAFCLLTSAATAYAQPRTWTLWEVSETTETKRVGSTYVTTPTNYLALPMERDLERGACEIVKEGKIRNRHRLFESARPFPDGVILQTSRGDTIQTMRTQYLCLRADEKPPEGRTGP